MMRYSSTFRTASRIFVCGVVSILSWTMSPPVALGLAFTNDPLVPGLTITTAHVTELRATVDTIRQQLGLAPYPWTDPVLSSQSPLIKRAHVVDLRTALDEIAQTSGQPRPSFTDATIVVGQTVVKAAHLNDARRAVRALFNPTISGPLVAGSQTVSGTGIPGAIVQVFVNGVPRGAPVVVNAQGRWVASNLTPPLAQGDNVAAQGAVSGPPSAVSAVAIVAPPPALYAGTSGGGVFKSTNEGGSWSAVNTGLNSTSIFALAIDPAAPTTLYAGTFAGGVLKSTNGGGSWSAVNSGLTNTIVETVAVDPETTATLYAGTFAGGVFKSSNGGGSWSAVNTGLTNTTVHALAVGTATPATLYTRTDGGGVLQNGNPGIRGGTVN